MESSPEMKNKPVESSSVHLVLAGKGGVGKSLISSLLAEYLMDRGTDTRCFDTDPTNPTFTGFQAFRVEPVRLYNDRTINEAAFDYIIERTISEPVSTVIDNGATTFIPLTHYLHDNQALAVLIENGLRVVVHSVIYGGEARNMTLQNFGDLVEALPPGVDVVVWLNEHKGAITNDKGESFENMPIYQKYKSMIKGIITLPPPKSTLFDQDLQMIRSRFLTFAEAANDPSIGIMSRQRLKVLRQEFFQSIALIPVI